MTKEERKKQLHSRIFYTCLFIADAISIGLFAAGCNREFGPVKEQTAEVSAKLQEQEKPAESVKEKNPEVAPVQPGERVESSAGMSEDVNRLAHLIYAEAGAEYISDETLEMVGSVVLNRVKSELYPDTIEEVVADTQHAVQYACKDYYMDLEPTARCYEIAEELIKNGSILPAGVLGQSSVLSKGWSVYDIVDGILFSRYEKNEK